MSGALRKWLTDETDAMVIDEHIEVECLPVCTELLSNWDVSWSISIHHSTSLSAAGDIIYLLWNGIKGPKQQYLTSTTVDPLAHKWGEDWWNVVEIFGRWHCPVFNFQMVFKVLPKKLKATQWILGGFQPPVKKCRWLWLCEKKHGGDICCRL